MSLNQQTYIIQFENVSDAEANRYAAELRDFLLDATPDIEVDRKRNDPHTQDFGATLLLLVGTPAAAAAAKAIGNWLALRRGTITIKRGEDGEILECSATNLSEKGQLELVKLLTAK